MGRVGWCFTAVDDGLRAHLFFQKTVRGLERHDAADFSLDFTAGIGRSLGLKSAIGQGHAL